MKQARVPSALMAGLAMVGSLVLWTPSRAQEAVGINAFSVWHGQGQIVQIGSTRAALTGVFSGTLFVETDEGPVDTGTIACPVVVHIDLEAGTQLGRGNCTFTARDGARIYSEFTCEGVHLVGCRGELKVTGGEGRLQKASGSGSMLLRGRLHEFAKQPGALVTTESIGIAVWRDLKLTTD